MDEVALAHIEEAGLNASAPPEQCLVDGWLVRFNRGKSKRARCVNAIAQGHLPLDRKLERLQRFYRSVRLPLFIRITPFCLPPALDAELAARGWGMLDDIRVMVSVALDTLVTPPWNGGESMHPADAAAFAEAVGSLRGSPADQRQAHARRLLNAPVAHEGVLLRDADGALLACAQAAVEDEVVGLYDVFTAEHARSQGLAQRLCAALLARARARGVRMAYLQVDASNAPARRAYGKLGFKDAYVYHYRAAPPES